jgi:hypothetical protein
MRAYIPLILLTIIAFFILRAIYRKIKGICVLFKRGKKREAWKVIFRTARFLLVVVIGIALIKYMMISGVIILTVAIMMISGSSKHDVPSYYYDD